MAKKSSSWYFPPDLGCLLAPWLALIPMFAGNLLSFIFELGSRDVLEVFLLALALSAIGVILLFLARLPLYRQRRFWTFGPRHLDRRHRRFYGLAYVFVLAGIGLLAVVCLRTR